MRGASSQGRQMGAMEAEAEQKGEAGSGQCGARERGAAIEQRCRCRRRGLPAGGAWALPAVAGSGFRLELVRC